MEGTDPHGRRLALATGVLATAWVAGMLAWTRDVSLPPDAAAYGVIARNLARGDGYTESFVPFHPGFYDSVRHLPDLHGLLRPLVLAPLFAWFGPSAVVVRAPGALAVAATALAVFALGRRLAGGPAGFLAALVVLASPSLFVAAMLGTDDTGFMLLATLTVALLASAVRERRPGRLAVAGFLMGVAILEKPIGVFLPLVGLVACAMLRGAGGVPARALLGLLGPPALACGAYLARNVLAHGSLDFRFGGLEWLWKDGGFEPMMALYERAPTTLETLRGLGARRVLEITGAQLAWYARATLALRPVVPAALAEVLAVVAAPAFLPALALLVLPVLRRRAPALAALTLATALAAPAVVCTLWHAEARYFSVLIPLAALAVAGAAGPAGRLGAAGMAVLVLLSAAGLARVARTVVDLPRLCPEAVAWLAREGGAGPVLTFDPWTIAWLADRETVMIPSGGPDAVARVARHYGADLLLAHPMLGRPESTRAVAFEGTRGPLRLTTLHRADGCRVARVEVAP